jgi:hypothetical protein
MCLSLYSCARCGAQSNSFAPAVVAAAIIEGLGLPEKWGELATRHYL